MNNEETNFSVDELQTIIKRANEAATKALAEKLAAQADNGESFDSYCGVIPTFTPENVEQPKCPYAAGFMQGWYTGYMLGQVKEAMKEKGA